MNLQQQTKQNYSSHTSYILFPRKKIVSFFIIVFLYLAGLCVTAITKPPYILNILIVYLPGLVYTLFLLKRSRKKIILFGLISLLFIIPVEIIARDSNSWDVLSVFPRILGIAPIENIIYAIVNLTFPLAFYEYFYDEDRSGTLSRNWKYLFSIYCVLFASTLVWFFNFREVFHLNYFFIGITIILPLLFALLTIKRHIIKRLLVPAVTFGAMFAIHELLSMQLGHWWWPGEYLLPISVMGQVYPLDDFIIWILLSNIGVIVGYELLWD